MRTLVIAPHPDDEVLGVGGTLLRRKEEGNQIGWLIMTQMTKDFSVDPEQIGRRRSEIDKVSSFFDFDCSYEFEFATTTLDEVPIRELVDKVSLVINDFKPTEVFVPHYSDVHSDHRVTFKVAMSCAKWFRNPSIKRILAYETLSETGYSLNTNMNFQPTSYVNIENYLERKKKALDIYESEVGVHPFPRSSVALEAQAHLRGSQSGFIAAEAFQLLQERM